MKIILAITLVLFVVGGDAFIDLLDGECKKKDDPCDYDSHCCAEFHCYYENGLSLSADGVCVECVGRGLKCQRDVQCCGENLLCQKENLYSINGVCATLKPSKAPCYKDSQCASKGCIKAHIWSFHGTCA